MCVFAVACARSLEEVTADALSIQAINRFVDPNDIAALTMFLASDAAKSISGQTFPIDGFSKGGSVADRSRSTLRAAVGMSELASID